MGEFFVHMCLCHQAV